MPAVAPPGSRRRSRSGRGSCRRSAAGGTLDEADGLVAVDAGGRIAFVGAVGVGRAGRSVLGGAVDLRPWVVLPGLVDLHAHLPQVPNAGLGFALALLDWLDRLTFPTERSWADPAVAERLAPAIFRAFAAAGTTTVLAYGVVYEAAMDAAFRAAEAHGIRAILGKVMMDRLTYDPTIEPATILDRTLRESADLVGALARRGRRPARLRGDAAVRRLVHGRAAARVAPSLARSTRLLVADATSRRTAARSRRSRGCFPEARDYVDVYDRAGALGARSVLAHAIHLSDREQARLVETGTRDRHCPASNLFIGAGVMPLARWLEAGVAVGLGSDVSGGAGAVALLRDARGRILRRWRARALGRRGRRCRAARAARLAPARDARRGAGARARRSDRLDRGRQGGRHDRRRSRR